MNQENAIEVRNMSKRFKIEYDKSRTLKERLIRRKGKIEYNEVLKNINLDIKKGECVALIGTNGSGKSTLLKLMTKIIFPNEGTIATNGKLTSLLELGAGFHEDFTGRENIYFNAAIFGLNKEEIDRRIDDIIAFSELGSFIDNPIRTYSSGMYMRLAFSVAINVDAEILLIDEILAVGDQHFQDKCYAKLQELRDSGKTIVIVTHSLNVVKELCSRVVWIYKGEVRLDGDPVFVIQEYLEQIAKDHKESIKKAIETGQTQKKGVVFIDMPRDFAQIDRKADVIKCGGWMVANDEKATLAFEVDEQPFDPIVSYVNRQDVYDIYFEEFGGFLDADHIGWDCEIDPTKLSSGKHTFTVKCIDSDGKELANKTIAFSIGE